MTRKCTVPGCDRDHSAKGLCRRHYARQYRRGTIDDPPPGPEGCRVEGCERDHHALGYCAKHYQRLIKTGAPDTPLRCRPFTKWEDEQVEGLPTTGRGANRVESGRLADLAMMLGRTKPALCQRRARLRRRARVTARRGDP